MNMKLDEWLKLSDKEKLEHVRADYAAIRAENKAAMDLIREIASWTKGKEEDRDAISSRHRAIEAARKIVEKTE